MNKEDFLIKNDRKEADLVLLIQALTTQCMSTQTQVKKDISINKQL